LRNERTRRVNLSDTACRYRKYVGVYRDAKPSLGGVVKKMSDRPINIGSSSLSLSIIRCRRRNSVLLRVVLRSRGQVGVAASRRLASVTRYVQPEPFAPYSGVPKLNGPLDIGDRLNELRLSSTAYYHDDVRDRSYVRDRRADCPKTLFVRSHGKQPSGTRCAREQIATGFVLRHGCSRMFERTRSQ